MTITQQMYNAVDMALYGDELNRFIKVAPTELIKFPTGNYTIHTREELLSYLDSLPENMYSNEHCVPLNYFVDPVALFTVDEMLSGVYKHYFSIINKRRELTPSQFVFLRKWLISQGLSINTPLDITKGYFHWG